MLFALTGAAGSGKDTAADRILQKYPSVTRASLAAPIKELANRWLGINEDYLQRGVKESLVAFNIKAPQFKCLDLIIYDMFKDHPLINMVSVKTVAGAIYDNILKDNMFCNVSEEEVAPQFLITTPRRILQIIGTEGFRECISDSFWLDIAPKENVIITDVRFPNEVQWVKDNGGVLVKVVRDNKKIEASDHVSEQGVPDEACDQVVYNHQDIELYSQGMLEVYQMFNDLEEEC